MSLGRIVGCGGLWDKKLARILCQYNFCCFSGEDTGYVPHSALCRGGAFVLNYVKRRKIQVTMHHTIIIVVIVMIIIGLFINDLMNFAP